MTRRTLLRSSLLVALAPSAALGATTRTYTSPRRGIRPAVDVFPADRPRGAVLVVHGGAFVVGSRRRPAVRRVADALREAGLTALAVDYRMLLRGGGFDEALDDVLACMDWWRATGGAEPLGLLGMSAGAALAAVAATEGRAQAWVGVYGPYDFTRLPGQPVFDQPTRWLLRSRDPGDWRARSPLARATAPIPTLLFHGTRDALVPAAHSEALVEARRAAGLPVALRTFDAGHGYLGQPAAPAARETLRAASRFLAEALGGPPQPSASPGPG